MSDLTEGTSETTGSTKARAKRVRKAAKAKAKSKMDRARSIFKSMSRGANGPDRAKVIEKLVKEVKLTPKGASTYYQTLKTEASA